MSSLRKLLLVIIAVASGRGAGTALGQTCSTLDYCASTSEIAPPNPAPYLGFGYDIAVSGNVMIISSVGQHPNVGKARIYRFDGTLWQLEATLSDPSTNSTSFGFSVSIDGNLAIVGDPYTEDYAGAVLIFRYNGSQWVQEARLVGQTQQMGGKVKIRGDTALITENSDSPAGISTGVVRVYRYIASNWVLSYTLEPTIAGNHASFGRYLALYNNFLAIGAPNTSFVGAVYIYELISDNWNLKQVIMAHSGVDTFGQSVALQNDLLVVGGYQPDTLLGIASIYRKISHSWSLEGTLAAADQEEFDNYAFSLAVIDGNHLMVGSPGHDCTGGNACGAAYVYEKSGGSWSQLAKLRGSSVFGGEFGWSVVAAGQQVFVGAKGERHPPGSTMNCGLTYIYPFTVDGPDCDCDGSADTCEFNEGEADCNSNAVPDSCDIAEATSTDCDLNGVPDECQVDCQPNGLADRCDIDLGSSLDCNSNSTPDECETAMVDCNSNSVPDDCDVSSGTSLDCNNNGDPDDCDVIEFDCNGNLVPDDCDIAGGFSLDSNNDGYPDECGFPVLDSLLADPSGIKKCRFISFVVPGGSGSLNTAMRIWMVSLHNVVPPYAGGPTIPFDLFEGQVVWVGPPGTYVESAVSQTPFRAALTQCTPHYQNWSTVGLLHVTGSHIVPSSIYEVQQVSASCQGQESSCPVVSQRLEIGTTRWGDVSENFNPPSPTAQPDIADIGSLVNKFKGAPGAPIKARALITPSNAFGEATISQMTLDVSFSAIASCLDAFRGPGYPASMGKCANGNVGCATHAECGANGPCELYCPD